MNSISLQTNEIFEAGAALYINDEYVDDMKNIVINSVLDMYEHGVKSANSKDFILDTKRENGEIAYQWNNGEIPPVGTVCLVMVTDEDSIALNRFGEKVLWRITGNTIKYNGQPLIDREYMEIITRR